MNPENIEKAQKLVKELNHLNERLSSLEDMSLEDIALHWDDNREHPKKFIGLNHWRVNLCDESRLLMEAAILSSKELYIKAMLIQKEYLQQEIEML